jgi:glycerophosphoryl diester phosphodiesterase
VHAFSARRGRSLLFAILATLSLVVLLIVAPATGQVHAVDVFGALRAPGEGAFIAGHRGDRSQAPENTMPAFEHALAGAMDFIEADVQLTSDGVPVMFHDVTLERTTTGQGRVSEHTASELARLDAGSWYSSEYEGVRIPTLDEFLALVAESEKKAMVELKFAWTADQVTTVIDSIDRHQTRGQVVLQTFSIETLVNLQAVAPGIPRIMLVRELPSQPVPMAQRFGVVGLGTTAAAVARSAGAVEQLHEAGIGLICYTLNTQDSWSEVRALGVDGIITDTPSELDAWLASTSNGT